MMDDVLGYSGKRVVVTGSASGMGAAACQILVDLGAEVAGIDVRPTEVPVKTSVIADLRDPAAIDATVAQIGGPVDAVFSVAGVPGPPFSDVDTLVVNFVGARYLIESLLPAMPEGSAVTCVASVGGLGWQNEWKGLRPLVTTEGFEAGKAWCEANPSAISFPYVFSKKVLNAWVAWRAVQLVTQGIRLNCINPGPTQTGMMPAFEAQWGPMVDAFIGPSRRRSSPEEQAWPLVFLNSPRASYIAGEALQTDAGFAAAMATEQFEVHLPAADGEG